MDRLILFDLDGVLLDSWEAGLQVIRQLADFAGVLRPKKNFIRKKWGHTGIKLVQSIFPDLAYKEQERLREFFKEFNNKPLENKIKIVDGSAETLTNLKKMGNKIGLCTNRSLRLKEHLEKLERVEFDIILSCENPLEKQELICENHFLVKFAKPDSKFFEPALLFAEKQNIPKENISFIGDTLVDLEGARNAGINFFGVMTGAINTRKHWWKWGGLESKFVINSVADLPEWFETNNKPC